MNHPSLSSPVDGEALVPVRSFDPQGQVFLGASRVLRGIFQGYAEQCRLVLDTMTRHDLFHLGIVRTRVVDDVNLPGGPYELVLEHQRVPFVSYPHEWSASMLKDAALFHLDLFIELAPHGLTLKDMHPLNVMFDGAKPTFVDFTSVIPVDALPSEKYLQSAQRPSRLSSRSWDRQAVLVNEMYERMFVPYFQRPLEMMSEGRYADARRRMLETTLNTSGEVISRHETKSGPWLRDVRRRFAHDRALYDPDPAKVRFFDRLRGEVDSLEVAPSDSAYLNFYAAKGEEFGMEPSPAWTSRQRTIHAILRRLRPASVLDVAGNTGWFSKLAAANGARVASFDIDESSADHLYLDGKAGASGVLSLVMDITSPTEEIAAIAYDDEPRRAFENAPVLMPATERLRCDLVLALAIVHHLALGQGIGLSNIVDLLEGFSRKSLAVEFVDRQDPLIVSEPEFFPAMHRNPDGFDWYSLSSFETELRKRFATVERLPSYPASRTILLCSR